MILSLSLQQAVLAHLSADTPLTAALGGPHLFDAPPHRASTSDAFPAIVLGDETVRAWNTGEMRGAEHDFGLVIWSRERGYAEVKTIMAALHRALDGAALPLAGGQLVSIRFLSASVTREAGGRYRRAGCRFRALVEADDTG